MSRESVVGFPPRARSPGAAHRSRARSSRIPTLLCACIGSLCFAASAAGPSRVHPRPPVLQRPAPALLSVLGDSPQLRITAVDNVPIQQIPDRALLRDPKATTERGSVVGVWLTPGAHLVHSQFVSNMADGINLSQGNVRLVAAPGHTYFIHPNIRSERAKASFDIVDKGTSFPQVCLPGVLDNERRAQTGGRFSQQDIGACLRGPGRR